MSTSLTTLINLTANVTAKKTDDLVTVNAPLTKSYKASLGSGVGAAAADTMFADTRQLAGGAHEDLDLAGVLIDPTGDVVNLARVKAIIVSAAATNTGPIQVGGAAANGWATWVADATDKVVLQPGSTFALFAGAADAVAYAVTPATGDLLTVTNPGVDVATYDVIVVGASA